VLKENTRLKCLKLGMNRLDDKNAARIFKSLGKNDYLEELDLSSNELGHMVYNIYFNLVYFGSYICTSNQ
jgi:hypothetical protein